MKKHTQEMGEVCSIKLQIITALKESWTVLIQPPNLQPVVHYFNIIL